MPVADAGIATGRNFFFLAAVLPMRVDRPLHQRHACAALPHYGYSKE